MVRRFIAIVFAVAMLFSVPLASADAHKIERCYLERSWDYNMGQWLVIERCECVEHQHGGSTMEGDNVPTGETPAGGTPAG